MKIKELRELSKQELAQKEEDLRAALFNLRTQLQLGKLEHPHQLKLMRRDIAKIKTVLKEEINKSAKK
ncbi:50S ribosomal protein L29 [bacterium]|nr:50S ribosomal protein L29 [bacterium]